MANTVLIMDGEDAVREIIKSMLRSGGYDTHEAKSGIEALALMKSGIRVDAIVSELMMTEMDGIGLLEQVQQKYPEVPFIVVTGVYDNSVMEAAIRYGASDYILKPFERDQLLAVVDRALYGRRPAVAELLARVKRETEENRERDQEQPALHPATPAPQPMVQPTPDYDDLEDLSARIETLENELSSGRTDDDDLEDLRARIETLESERSGGDGGSAGAAVGISMGSALAMVLSWSTNRSILFCIVHGICSWFYVIYWAIVYRLLS